MSQTLNLYRLQQTDSQLDRSHARLKTIQEMLEDDAELQQVRELAEKAREAYASTQQTLHQAENAVRDQRIKIEQTESNLYSGTVRNPKELQDLQNDVASLKRHLATLEDHQLETMIAFDEASTANQSAQMNLQLTDAKTLQSNQSLAQERDLLLKETEKLSAERRAIIVAIPVDVLGNYESLRKLRRGVAVAMVTDKACSACGTTLSPMQVQNIIMTADLTYCPTCGRILYSG